MIFVLLINKQGAVFRQVVPLRYNGGENRLNICFGDETALKTPKIMQIV